VYVFTSRDVARLAGVSQSTVSYVLSGKRTISPRTRERVQAAIEQLTYQPNAGARALASRRTRVIAIVVAFGGTADGAGLLPFLETITQCARERDHDVLLVGAQEGADALTRLDGRSQCDAVVLMEIEAEDERIAAISGLRIPVILIGVPNASDRLHCVDVDFEEAGRLAVREVAETGRRQVAVIGYPPEAVRRDLNYVARFQRGVDQAVAEARLDCELIAPVPATRAGARDAVARVVSAGERALRETGLIVPNTAAIQEVLRGLRAHGLAPGRDVPVVGVCTDAAAEAMEPAVSNVSLEPRDVSRRAMRTLFALLENEQGTHAGDRPRARVQLVTPRLTRRETTADALDAPAVQ
jgi:DNA-binding LacI/PurR family transcriptional regulator